MSGAAAPGPRLPCETEDGRPRLLVVEEDPSARALLTRLLRDAGFSVEAATDGATALAALRRRGFAVVMIDLRLPGMSGPELATVVATRWPDTAVLIMSVPADVEAAVQCLRDGAYDYLTKPFELDSVVARVRRALERRRSLLVRRQEQRDLEGLARQETRTARRYFLGAIRSLCSALEAKDDYTRGHSERVSQIGVHIALAVGADRKEVRSIRLAGRLHDIGKIGVRESVLGKPSALTEDEYRHVQTHPVVGERILAQGLIDPRTVAIVRHHHEHYGGGGYPDGLSGSEIPLGARVLAVADAFDALTSDRPYRGRLEVGAALEVLRRGGGSQWQPTLVEALSQQVWAMRAIVEEEAGR